MITLALKNRLLQQEETPPYDILLLADPSKEMVDRYLINGICLIWEHDQEIIGVAVLKELDEKKAEIMNIAVLSEYQGRGIGKKILMETISKAKEYGFIELFIGTGNSSINQLALYQKCGFRISSIERDFFTKNYREPIIENSIPCVDMIRLSQKL
ncbi:GNAT family N-acetyltransferase [Sutcliffiella halmapala]|uniref:GNAT family N-acetyltransferase n=1 Tax=Sutcliffiella halmapala TaxID=79882 RepID=UPI001F1CA8D5|nr:GNAT family N-acetyltransferase [Sutcliffiella halmapala]